MKKQTRNRLIDHRKLTDSCQRGVELRGLDETDEGIKQTFLKIHRHRRQSNGYQRKRWMRGGKGR